MSAVITESHLSPAVRGFTFNCSQPHHLNCPHCWKTLLHQRSSSFSRWTCWSVTLLDPNKEFTELLLSNMGKRPSCHVCSKKASCIQQMSSPCFPSASSCSVFVQVRALNKSDSHAVLKKVGINEKKVLTYPNCWLKSKQKKSVLEQHIWQMCCTYAHTYPHSATIVTSLSLWGLSIGFH